MGCQSSESSPMISSEGIFPSVQGNNLNKKSKTVPDDFVDKDLIVIVAFQQWHQAIVDETIDSLEESGIGDTHNIIEVPTIQKSSKLSEIYLDGIMRAGIRDDRIRNRTITAYINKEEFKKQSTAEGEEMNVKIVTMDVKKMENLQDLLTQTGPKNKQLKSYIKNGLNLKKIWLKSYKKQKEKIRG